LSILVHPVGVLAERRFGRFFYPWRRTPRQRTVIAVTETVTDDIGALEAAPQAGAMTIQR
jgi:hypothetical protein